MNSRLRELIRNGVDPRLLHQASCPQGGKSSPPPAPDYTGAANAQSAASKEIANQQTWANRPDQYTPWGSTTWDAAKAKDPATGQDITQWTQQQSLNPQLQGALDQQLGLQGQRSDLAGSFMGRVQQDYQNPFNWSGLPKASAGPNVQATGTYDPTAMIQGQKIDTSAPRQTTQTTNAPAFAKERQQYTEAMWNNMQPQHQRQEDQTRTMLANQGLTPGSEAYNTELERLSGVQAGERWNAIQAGGQEQQRMNQQLLAQQGQAFGQDVQGQQAQNAAMGQRFGQDLSQGQFYNAAGQQAFNQDLSSNNQNFQQQLQQSNYQNQLRQQAIAEQAQARGMSLNEMNALLHGQQINSPQMPSFMGASAGQAPNLLGAAQSQGQYGMQAAKMENDASSALWGGIGSAAGAAAMMF